MKTKFTQAQLHIARFKDAKIAQFHDEAERYKSLAKDLALRVVTDSPASPEDFKRVTLLKEHLIRAETFKSAATLIANSWLP